MVIEHGGLTDVQDCLARGYHGWHMGVIMSCLLTAHTPTPLSELVS